MKRVYFDNAATTPLHPAVIAEMTQAMQEHYGNPSSIHAEGRTVRSLIEKARRSVADRINASIGEVFFTSGGTEANNMAIKCAVRDLGVQRIITSAIEHHCVLHSVERMEAEGIQVDWVPVDQLGRIELAALEGLLQDSSKKTLVSLMHANNEIGTMIDLKEVGELCREYGAFFHSDTVQTIGHFPMNVQDCPVHFLSGSAHKFHGPKGVGFIYINGDNQLKPYLDGGAQERNMRAGTENVYGILGMAKALELACDNMDAHRQHMEQLRQRMIAQLQAAIPGVEFNGDYQGNALYTVLNVSFPPSPKTEMLLLSLDIAGVSASGGSACSSGADAGSHVIQALKADPDRRMVRFSFSAFNTLEEVDWVVHQIKSILPEQVVD